MAIRSSSLLHTVLLSIALSLSCSAQTDGRATFSVPPPAAAALRSADQQLTFTVTTPPPTLKGLQVFLNPSPDKHLTPSDKGFLASVFFSDEGSPSAHTPARSTFTLPLQQAVSARSRLVLLPICTGSSAPPPITILEAHIAAPDNSAFH